MTDDLEWQLRSVRSDVESLTDRANRLEGDLDDLQRSNSSLDSDVTELRGDLERLASEHQDADAELGQTQKKMRALDRRVQWIERRMRAASGERPVDLDRIEPAQERLLDLVRAGDQASERLLSEVQRYVLEGRVTAHTSARNRTKQGRAAVVAASTDLVNLPFDDQAHLGAVNRFRSGRQQATDGAKDTASLAAAAAQARARLQADDKVRRQSAGIVQAGADAQEQLLAQVRARIATAAAEAALLPVWFTTAFGPLPAAKATERWLDAAAAAVLYRMTYGVTDPVLVLGGEPEGGVQLEQYEELRKQVTRWAA